jgi:PAS domain S-box-containing protein
MLALPVFEVIGHMSSFNLVSLGLLLVLAGLAIYIVIRMILGVVSRYKPRIIDKSKLPVLDNLEPNEDAILFIAPGGVLASMNGNARQVFNLDNYDNPSLEKLTRRMRPGEVFLGLCASEGRGRFLLDGRWVEGTSTRLAMLSPSLMLVTLRFSQSLSESELQKKDIQGQNYEGNKAFTRAVFSSLELETTIASVFENIQNVLEADTLEITILDQDSGTLIPYQCVDLASGNRNIDIPTYRYSMDKGYSGYLAKERKPLLIENIEVLTEISPIKDLNRTPVRSYIGIPLLFENEFIGTLEAGSFATEAFNQSDLDFLQSISDQVTISIRNSLLYQTEQRQSAELRSLSQITQAFSSIRNSQDLYNRLVQSVLSLVPVKILGFLIYNDYERLLVAQVPFFGLPPQFVELYRIPVLSGSLLEETMVSQDVIISENAIEDLQWEKFGMAALAQAASIQDTVLVPLTSSGRMLGYLQAGNHLDGSKVFSNEELHLLTIVASQAAPIIENATLMDQARQRAQRAEGLRRIASMAGSAEGYDEVLKDAIHELVQIVGADVGVFSILERERARLQVHPSSMAGLPKGISGSKWFLSVEDAQYPFCASGSQHAVILERKHQDKPVIPYYQKMMDAWKIDSAIVAPLVVHNEGVGELWLGSHSPQMFDQGDLQVLVTAASLLAGVVDQTFTARQTDESLRRRVDQLSALTRISRELGTSLDLQSLMQLVYDEARRTTRADCGSIALFDHRSETSDQPIIRFYIGDEIDERLTGVQMAIIQQQEAVVIQLSGRSDFPSPHPDVKTLLVAPILLNQRPLGIIVLHSKQTETFDQTAREIAQSLAAQAAIAFSNAMLYEDQIERGELLKRELDTLGELFKVFQSQQPNRSLDESLQMISNAVCAATPFQIALVSVYDMADTHLHRTCSTGLPDDAWEELCRHSQPWHAIEQVLQAEFQIGNAYFIPGDKLPVVPQDIHTVTVLPSFKTDVRDAWDAEDMLLIPLYSAEHQPLGLISLDAPRDGRRPDRATYETLELFATQAAMTIETSRFIHNQEVHVSELEADRQKLVQLAERSQTELPRMIKTEEEQIWLINKLHLQTERIRVGLNLADLSAKGMELPALLRAMASEFLAKYNMQAALVTVQSETGDPEIIARSGNLPSEVKLDALLGQRNPIRLVVEQGQGLIISNLQVDDEWKDSPILAAMGAKSAMVLPLITGVQKGMTLLAIGVEPMDEMTTEDCQLAMQTARQIGIYLQNLQLLDETQHRLQEMDLLLAFSRKLGNLDVRKIVQALVTTLWQVIIPAEAICIFMADKETDCLQAILAEGYADTKSILQVSYPLLNTSLPVKVFTDGKPVRISDLQFSQEYSLDTENLNRYRQGTGGKLPVTCLVVPIQRGENTRGVIVIDNFLQAGIFTREDEDLVLGLAQQTALALENAALYEEQIQRAAELDERSKRLALLNRLSSDLAASLDVDVMMKLALHHFKDALGGDGGTAVMLSENGHGRMQVEEPETDLVLPVDLPDIPLLEKIQASQEIFSTKDVPSVADLGPYCHEYFMSRDTHSLLVVPLSVGSLLIGWFWLLKKGAWQFSMAEIELARTICNQTAIAIQNARLLSETKRLSEDLERQVEERTAELRREHLSSQTLLKIISELSSSLEMEQVINRTLSVMNDSTGAEQSIILLASRDAPIYRTGKSLAWLPSALDGVRTSPEWEIAKWVIDRRQAALIDEIHYDPRWNFVDTLHLDYHSVIAVPLIAGDDVLGAILLLHSKSKAFSLEQTGLMEATAKQISITLNNAELFKLIRDQSTYLAAMLDDQQKESSRSRAILEAVADGVLVTDAGNRVTLFNISAGRILDILPEKIIGQSLDDFSGLFGEVANQWLQTIHAWSSINTKSTNDEMFTGRIELEHERVIEVHLAPVFWSSGFLGTVSIFRDITHEVQVDRMKSEFVANVSHELRTPMTSIKGYIEILLMGAAGPVSEKQTHFLKIVKSNTERLNILVNDLLDVSRIESGRVTLELQPVHLDEIARDVAAEIRRRAQDEEKPMKVAMDTPSGLPSVRGDVERVAQILSILVSNSFNYTPDDGEITIRVIPAGTEVQVDVIDNGIGIAPAQQSRIFERFYRGENPLVMATSGAGLGLSIVKALVEMHGGRIWFKSTGVQGEGSVFSFTLPVYG